jgi:hypothetical protein
LDNTITSHQEAFKDFEKYAAYCKGEVSEYDTLDARVTEINHQFPSLQAKKSFENYKKSLKKLSGLIFLNSVLKGLTLGFSERLYGYYFSSKLSNEQVIGINFLASIGIILNEAYSKKEEPYFNTGNLKTGPNLFGLKNPETLARIFITMFTIECARVLGK